MYANNPINHSSADVFSADYLLADIKVRTVRGGIITLAGQLLKFIMQLGVTAILARMLTPTDFGLVAMVTAVTGFVALFKDAGLCMATVQQQRITHDQISTVFWINFGLGITLMFVTAAIAPCLAWLYDEPRLTYIALSLAFTFVLSGISAQHQALLQRHMKFKNLAIIDVLSMAVGAVAAVALAETYHTYWALVALPIGTATTNALSLWILSPWRPGPPGSLAGVWEMLGYGGYVSAFNITNYFRRNADNILIGMFHGASALGLYSKAYGLLMLPVSQINAPLTSVAMPALSRLRGDEAEFRSAYKAAIGSLALLTMPMTVFMGISATTIVPLVFGPQWSSAVPIFQVLSIVGLLESLNVATGWIYLSLGNTKRQFYWGLIQSAAFVVAFTIGLNWGAFGVALAYAVATILLRPIAIVVCYYRTPIGVLDLLSAIALPSVATLCAAGATVFGSTYLFGQVNLFLKLGMLVIVYGSVYTIVIGSNVSGRQRIGMLSRHVLRRNGKMLPTRGI